MEEIKHVNRFGNDYDNILREILKKADYDNNEIWFMDIYQYLERIKRKELMPFVIKDIEKIGLEIIFSKVSEVYNSFAIHNR